MNEQAWCKEFKKRIRKRLVDLDMAQKDLAIKLGISESTMSRYINGKCMPDAILCVRIAKALKCSVADLIEFEEDEL